MVDRSAALELAPGCIVWARPASARALVAAG